MPPENRTLGDINNPLATGYVVQASFHKGTVLWSLQNLENVGHSFLSQGQFFSENTDFLRYATTFNFVVDLKHLLHPSAHFKMMVLRIRSKDRRSGT